MNKRILIITYYWPPSGGSGVQRWLKFVKYLVRAGWEPFVFTPENPSFTIHDPSLEKEVPPQAEVIRFPIWEPYQIFFKLNRLFGKKNLQQTDFISTGKKSFIQKISAWIRGNIFIPDARIFWVRPSVRYLADFVVRNRIEKIITTGPPHSVHLIGLRLKQLHPPLKWLADFRDPWSEWDLLDTLSLTTWARDWHRKLEKQVLTEADRLITIAPYHVKRLEALSGRKVDLITNGFDEEDFGEIAFKPTDNFIIRHVGVVDELRDPWPAMAAIRQLYNEDKVFAAKVAVEFVGTVNSAFKNGVNEDSVLSRITTFTGNIPHERLLDLRSTTGLQLLVLAHTTIAPGNLPGKFFEYLAARKPILAIGPVEGDAADILRETGAGVICAHTDAEAIRNALKKFFGEWKSGKTFSSNEIRQFSRQHLTEKLMAVLEQLK
jgi:glycosyltransferase involved in cell wall biosynthesis